MVWHILIQSALKMRESLNKFGVSETSHRQSKLRTLFDLMVGKHQHVHLEEENGVITRVLAKRIMLH
jgi:hypothetical protein